VVPFVCLVTKEVGEKNLLKDLWHFEMPLCLQMNSLHFAQFACLLALLDKIEVLNLVSLMWVEVGNFLFIYFNKIGMVSGNWYI
jgi:hypothetical protein